MDICEATVSELQQEIYKRNNQRLASIPKGSIVHPKMLVYEVYRNLLKNRHWSENTAFPLNNMKLWSCVKETNRGTLVEFSGLHIKTKTEEWIKHPTESYLCDLLLEDIIKYNEME